MVIPPEYLEREMAVFDALSKVFKEKDIFTQVTTSYKDIYELIKEIDRTYREAGDPISKVLVKHLESELEIHKKIYDYISRVKPELTGAKIELSKEYIDKKVNSTVELFSSIRDRISDEISEAFSILSEHTEAPIVKDIIDRINKAYLGDGYKEYTPEYMITTINEISKIILKFLGDRSKPKEQLKRDMLDIIEKYKKEASEHAIKPKEYVSKEFVDAVKYHIVKTLKTHPEKVLVQEDDRYKYMAIEYSKDKCYSDIKEYYSYLEWFRKEPEEAVSEKTIDSRLGGLTDQKVVGVYGIMFSTDGKTIDSSRERTSKSKYLVLRIPKI
jgi:hypothetical protein